MSEFFDDLARTLAQPMPRRRALRLLAGAVAAGAVPAAIARPASASTTLAEACAGCGVPHGAGCVLNKKCGTDVPGSPVCCTWPGYFGQFNYGDSGGYCAQAGGQGLDPPGGLACCCPTGSTCGSPPGPVCVASCSGPICSVDKKCCPRKQGRCVKGRCCPAIRTTFAPGTNGKGVACCPWGTVAVKGGTGLCCKKGNRDCCDKFDPRTGDDELSPLPPPRGKLCVNGKLRRA